MSTNGPGKLNSTPPPTDASVTQPSIEALPQEIRQHIRSFISIRERRDMNSFATTNSFFKQEMLPHQEAADLIPRMDGIRLTSRGALNNPNNLGHSLAKAKAISLVEEIVRKFDASPLLRPQLFRELLAFANDMANRDVAKACCSALWNAIPKLPEQDRADAIMALLFSAAIINAGEDPFPALELAYRHVTIASDKPQLIGILSVQLDHFSEADFPIKLSALFKEINQLPPREQCNALQAINSRLIGIAWRDKHPPGGKEVCEKKYQQLFAAAFQCISALPPEERVIAVGAWFSPPVWNGDHRTRDQMRIELLRRMPSNTPPTDETAKAIARQIASNFNDDARLHSLVRFQAVLGGIAHLSASLQAKVLENWCRLDTGLSHSGDLQWKAMSEACERLPDPEKGQVLAALANNIGMVGASFHADWGGTDEPGVGGSAEESARDIQRRRRAVAAEHQERHVNASAEYYESTSFSSTAALNTLLRLAGNVPMSQRIEVLNVLLDEDKFDDMHLRRISPQERQDVVSNIRDLIATVPDEQIRQSLKNMLDARLAERG